MLTAPQSYRRTVQYRYCDITGPGSKTNRNLNHGQDTRARALTHSLTNKPGHTLRGEPGHTRYSTVQKHRGSRKVLYSSESAAGWAPGWRGRARASGLVRFVRTRHVLSPTYILFPYQVPYTLFVLVCLDGCEVRLCDPCARVRPCAPVCPVSVPALTRLPRSRVMSVSCVSRLPPVFSRRNRRIHRQSFHFDTRGHRTSAHTDETSTPLEGPWTIHTPRQFSHLRLLRSRDAAGGFELRRDNARWRLSAS